MNRTLFLAIVVLASHGITATGQVYLAEDFSTASGFTPPTGWTISLAAGTPGVDGWRFDDPNGNGTTPPLSAPVATCDSDYSGPGTPVHAFLDSPAFDASTATLLKLEWDQWHRPLSSTVNVRVFDGSAWVVVYTNTAGTPQNDAQSVDITAATGGATNARVRFEYMGNFDWHWQVDNVRIFEVATTDAGVISIDAPVFTPGDCLGLGAAETVSITIQNFGTAPIPAGTQLPVEYVVDGGLQIVETMGLAQPIPPGGTVPYSFATPADFSSFGLHLVDARTHLFGDVVPGNDAVTGHAVVNGSGTPAISAFPWTEDFESTPASQTTTPPAGWINDTADNTGGIDSDWYFRNAATSSTNTGPPADHTSGSGYFAYVEDSGGNFAAVNLLTPCFDFTAVATPRLHYWVYSNDASGGTTQNFLAVDVVSYPGGVLTTDVVPPVGHLGHGWQLQVVDLAAFAFQVVRVRFRGRSDGGSFTHDLAIDDVVAFEYIPGSGQPPQPGLATLDINDATSGSATPVAMGSPGPYYTAVTPGLPIAYTFSGQPDKPIILLIGDLNPAAATFPGIGKIDIGGPIDPATGFPTGVTVLANGTVPTGTNLFFNTGPLGTSAITYTLPSFPPGVLTTFQALILNDTPAVVAATNAVEVTVL